MDSRIAFDGILSKEQQAGWLLEPTAYQDSTFRFVDAAQRAARHDQFERFSRSPLFTQIVSILKQYVCQTIPAYRKTERDFWSLSCLPGTNHSEWPRYACCSLNTMETFVIGHYKSEPDSIWAFINVANSILSQSFPDNAHFYRKHPETSLKFVSYKAAGPDLRQIGMKGLDQIESVVHDSGVLSAARYLNLKLMRKGATLQSHGHSLDLADHIVS